MTRKYFPFCFYVLVSVLCLGKPSLAYPSGSLNREGAILAVDATSETDSITPLKIGDKIPDELWDMTFPIVSAGSDEVQHLKLGDYRDKLIILDFWGSTCGPCIGSLNKLDSIQPLFEDDVFIFPINVDDSESLTRKSMSIRGWKLPSVVEDLTLKEYFPHYALPHQVWIKDNQVYAIPPAAYATADNFRQVIDEKPTIAFAERAVKQLDKSRPINSYELAEDAMFYQSTFTKRLPELAEMNYEGKDRWHHVNMSIEGLFHVAYSEELDGQFSYRVIWNLPGELENTLRRGNRHWRGDYEKDQFYDQWQNNHTFTYSLERKGITDDMARRIMQDDLNRFVGDRYGVKGSLVKESVEHLVIRRTNNKPLLETRGGETVLQLLNAPFVVQNRTITSLPLLIRNIRSDLPIKDMTGYPKSMKIDIRLTADIVDDIAAANKELKEYGLAISVEEIVLNKLEISQMK